MASLNTFQKPFEQPLEKDFRKIYGHTKESMQKRTKADDELRKKGIPLAPCIKEWVPPPPRMVSLNDPFRQVPPPPPPRGRSPTRRPLGDQQSSQFPDSQFSEGAKVGINPEGSEADNFQISEGAEEVINPEGSDVGNFQPNFQEGTELSPDCG